MCLQGFRQKASFGSLDLILSTSAHAIAMRRKKKKNQDSSVQFSSFPRKSSMWKWSPLSLRTTYCIQFIMLARDRKEGNVRVKQENRTETGSKRTKREQRRHLVPMAVIIALRGGLNRLLPQVISNTQALKFDELLFLSVGARFIVSCSHSCLSLSGLPLPPSVLHLKFWSYKIRCLHSFAVLPTRGCSSVALPRNSIQYVPTALLCDINRNITSFS